MLTPRRIYVRIGCLPLNLVFQSNFYAMRSGLHHTLPDFPNFPYFKSKPERPDPMELPIYLDHAATTPMLPAVMEAMLPYFLESYGNPSALHSVGMAAHEGVEQARKTIADTLNATPEEIVFTSGGTESDNTAIFGIANFAEANKERKRHLLTTPIEHHAVLDPFETLAQRGYEVEYLPVDHEGLVDPFDVERMLRPDTLLVSVMHANNEIGTLQPVGEIGAVCRAQSVRFHTDAVQTYGRIPIDVRAMKIDLLSLTGHKFYGPKGCGVLYVRRGTQLRRFMEGGGQERGRRGGTLNVPGIVGLGKAAEIAHTGMQAEIARLTQLRERFMSQLTRAVGGVHITGSRTERLPNNIHLLIEGVQGEPLLLALDAAGICASAGSACSAGSTEPSHVLKAIGIDRDLARGALRLTLGRSTDSEGLDYTLKTLVRTIEELRALSGTSQALGSDPDRTAVA